MMRLVCSEGDSFGEFLSLVKRSIPSPSPIMLELDGCTLENLLYLNAFCAIYINQAFRISIIFAEFLSQYNDLVFECLHFENSKVEFLEVDVQRDEQQPMLLDMFTFLVESPKFMIRQIQPGGFGSRFQHTERFFLALSKSNITHLKMDVRGNPYAVDQLVACIPFSSLQMLHIALTAQCLESFVQAVALSKITELNLSDSDILDIGSREEIRLKILADMEVIAGMDATTSETALNELMHRIKVGEKSLTKTFDEVVRSAADRAVLMHHHMQKLKLLNFGGCQLGTPGLLLLFQPLRLKYCGLTCLDISSNGLEDVGLRELCALLQKDGCCSLQRLVAYDNEFSMQAVVDYMFPLLKHENCKLLELEIVSEFGTDDDRLDAQRIDLAFSRMLFARKLFVLSSARVVKRISAQAHIRRLPNDLLRLLGDMLVVE